MSSTAHCPHTVRHCFGGFPAPTTLKECGQALQQLHYQTLTCSVAKDCSRALQQVHRPQPAGSSAVHYNFYTAQCTYALWWCIGAVPPPMPPKQCGGALQNFYHPVPTSNV